MFAKQMVVKKYKRVVSLLLVLILCFTMSASALGGYGVDNGDYYPEDNEVAYDISDDEYPPEDDDYIDVYDDDGGDEDDTDIDEYTITPVALGDALFEPHTGSVFDPGARSLRFQGDGWNAYTVRQFISPTPPAGTYTFSFWIRGQLSNSDYLGIDFENDENPHLRYLISRTYLRTVSTMEWTQIVVEDLMFNASTNWTHMRIDGHNWSSGSIYLDGFSMREQIGGDPNNLGSNLIRNPGFENGRNYWWAGWDNEQPANFSGGFSLHTWLSADIDDVAILPNASLTDISYDGATISNIVVNIDGTDLDTVTWENFNVSVSGTGLSVANTAAARSWVPAADGYSGVLTLTVVAGANVGSARNGNITVAIGGENDNIAWNQLASPSSGGGHPAPAGMVVSAATRGTPTLTSFNAPIWNGAPVIETGRWKTFGSYTVAPETDAHGAFRVLWDDNYLWVHASVADDTFDISSAGSPWLRDSVEVFMYNGTNIYQIRVCRAETLSGNRIPNNVGYRVQEWPGDDGYDVIIQIPFPSGINAGIGSTFGFDLQVNDADGGTRVAIASVNDTTDTTNSNAAMLGEITLMPAGLTGWFRADALDGSIYSGRAHGMLIDRVANLGVGETDATQDNPPDQPLLVANNPAVNGRPTMRFGGNSFLDVLENNAFNITGEEITIVSLIGNDTGGSRGTIYSKGATVMLEHEWNGPRFVVRTDHSGWPNTWHQPGYNQNVADTAPRVPWHVLTGIHTAANNRIIYTSGSGTSQEWVMPTVQPGNIAHGNMNDSRDRIGAVLYHGSLTGSFAGDIAELMIFNTALTQAELDALNDRFYAKYFDEGGAVVIPTFVTDLVNPGFEMGSTTGWGRMADGDTTTNLTVTNADSNRGRYALEVSNRANAWDTASQDITDLLENLGPGWYDVSAFARYLDFASGTGQVTVRIRCSSIPDADPDWGQRFVGTPIVPIGNTWTEMQGAIYLNWVDLQSAVIYFNPDGGTSAPHPSFRVDDFDIVKTVPNPNFTVAISPGDLTVWDGSEYERSPLQSNDGVSHSLRVYNRTNGSAGPRFNIRELLEVYGPGYYDIGAFIRLEAGSTNGAIMVEIDPAVGANSWITVNGAPVDNTGFTELSGTVNLQWTGALNNAWLYFQSTGGDETANYFMDDITFRRSRGLNYDTSTNVIIYERTDFSGANALNFLSHDNADFSLRVNGMGVPVYQFNQNPATENRNPANTRATLGAFAFEGGSVTVEVTVNVPLHSFRILPTNTGIDVTHRGNTLTFVMDNPRQLMLEINGERDGQLMIFAEPPEPASVRPNPADPNVFVVDTGNITTTSIPPNANVLYFPAGSVTRISGGPSGHPGRLILPTRIHTVFIDGGAVLVGSLFDTGLRENLTIRGRGMLYNGDTAWAGGGNAIRLTGVRYFLFEDLMVIGASYHGIWMENRTILEARNVKIVGPFWWNTDGFQIQGTLGALVEDSFIFGQDDAFCVYNNVILRNNIVGNTQNGAAVAIGFWGFRPISNILVDGLTVLYGQATNIQPMIEILSYNGSPLNDIVIRNVWADNVDAGSFLRLMSDKRWVDTSINTGYSPGMMSDILFENISIDNIGGTIQGFDSMRGVSNVIFNNIEVRTPFATSIAENVGDLDLHLTSRHLHWNAGQPAPLPGAITNIRFNEPVVFIKGNHVRNITQGENVDIPVQTHTFAQLGRTIDRIELLVNGALHNGVDTASDFHNFTIANIAYGSHVAQARVRANGNWYYSPEYRYEARPSNQLLYNRYFTYDRLGSPATNNVRDWYPTVDKAFENPLDSWMGPAGSRTVNTPSNVTLTPVAGAGRAGGSSRAVRIEGRAETTDGIIQSFRQALTDWAESQNLGPPANNVTNYLEFSAWVRNDSVTSDMRFAVYYYDWRNTQLDALRRGANGPLWNGARMHFSDWQEVGTGWTEITFVLPVPANNYVLSWVHPTDFLFSIENDNPTAVYYIDSASLLIVSEPTPPDVPVTGITGLPTTATAETPLNLTGTVAPSNASNQTIVWAIVAPGTTGATITGNTLTTTAAGTVTVSATIIGGNADGTDFVYQFTITVNAASEGPPTDPPTDPPISTPSRNRDPFGRQGRQGGITPPPPTPEPILRIGDMDILLGRENAIFFGNTNFITDGIYTVSISDLPEGAIAPEYVTIENGRFELDITGLENVESGSYTFTFNIYDDEGRLLGTTDFTLVLEEEPFQEGTFLRFEIGEITYAKNGQPMQSDAAPFIDPTYNRTMVPLRIIAEALGAEVAWIEETRIVIIIRGDVELQLPIDEPLPAGMGMPAIVNDRTFVPLAYIANVLGADVSWDEDARVIYVQM